MRRSAVIIGAGINGLVAANYLARAGFRVTMLERKDGVGGACTTEKAVIEGREYEYPVGASLFGYMQDFVYEETGLSNVVTGYAPTHPEIVHFEGDREPCYLFDDTDVDAGALAKELRAKWGETGNVEEYFADMERVLVFLREGFRRAEPPTEAAARGALGGELAQRWIFGSARSLLEHYFTSDRTRMYYSVSVAESGPVPLDSPYSAFNLPLMNAGSVFGGRWGYVKGGIWQIPRALADINRSLGVELLTSARVTDVRAGGVAFEHEGSGRRIESDVVLFATDPLSASRMTGERALEETVASKRLLGTSGKLVLLFREPARWKNPTGLEDFDLAPRFIMSNPSMDDFERASHAAETATVPYVPGFHEIYPEGAGSRKLGHDPGYDIVSVFFKNLALDRPGSELPEVAADVKRKVLSLLLNPEDVVHEVLLTPRDLVDRFYFPGGNIDHVDLSEGQTFFQRNYSPNPGESFYQFGENPRHFYCGAGSYPCGSIAGTPGSMCAQQILRRI